MSNNLLLPVFEGLFISRSYGSLHRPENRLESPNRPNLPSAKTTPERDEGGGEGRGLVLMNHEYLMFPKVDFILSIIKLYLQGISCYPYYFPATSNKGSHSPA